MLGYYLNIIKINKNKRIIIHFLGIFGLFLLLKYHMKFLLKEKKKINFFNVLHLNILAYEVSVFIFFQNNFHLVFNKNKNFIKTISNYTFGIYLIHPLFNEYSNKIYMSNKSSNILYIIPIKSLIIFILSLSFKFSKKNY